MISIIIPHFNNSETVEASLVSAIRQTYKLKEIIIIDDGSTPAHVEKLRAVVNKYTNENIRIISNETNMGLPKSLNKAIRESKGDLIARLDSDDEWSSNQKLNLQAKRMGEADGLVLVGTVYEVFGNEKYADVKVPREREDYSIRSVLLWKNPFCHSSVVFKRSVFEKLGGYNESLKYTEDQDLWIRMARIGQVEILSDSLVRYYVNGQGMSSSTSILLKKWYQIRILILYGWFFPNKIKSFLKVVSNVLELYKIKRIFTS